MGSSVPFAGQRKGGEHCMKIMGRIWYDHRLFPLSLQVSLQYGHLSDLFLLKGQGKMTKRKQTLPKPEGTTAYPEKASSVGDKTTGVVVPSATTTSLDTTQPTVDKSKQQHEKLKGSSSSSAEAKAARKKTEKAVEVSHLATEKAIVLALKQQTQAPPDLNLPS